MFFDGTLNILTNRFLLKNRFKLQTPWKARTPAPTLERFEQYGDWDENLRQEMSLKTKGTVNQISIHTALENEIRKCKRDNW